MFRNFALKFKQMTRPLSLIQFLILFILCINAVLWLSSDFFCETIMSDMKINAKTYKRQLHEIDEIVRQLSPANTSRLREKVDAADVPVIYGITPTRRILTQKADLTRLCQTLQHVKNFHWILIEDSHHKTGMVARFLKRCRIKYTHLAVRTSRYLRHYRSDKAKHPRGMEQRNEGLKWLRKNFDPRNMKGVVYFIDDDNVYDTELFKKIRHTKGVAVWPVGLVGGLKWEGPLCEKNKVVGFRVAYRPKRPFPVDMAGFAINAKLFLDNPRLMFDPIDKNTGKSESAFLNLTGLARKDLEPLGDLCTKVLVWHTRTSKASLLMEDKLRGKKYPEIEI